MNQLVNFMNVIKKTLTQKKQEGFSLVELMVVVAIIGVLSVMSIGAVQKQIAKARQAEAKSSLSSMFTAQKAFQAEYNCFWSGFTTIAYSIEGRLRYNMGFNTTSTHTLATCGYTGTSTAATPASTNSYCGATATNNCTALTSATALSAGSADATSFTAQAIGAIYGATNDIWTINQAKTLSNTQDGLQ